MKNLNELRAYVGDLNSILGIKEYVLTDGKANGMRAMDLKNGIGLEMTILKERALDIPYLSYKGINIGFASKTGLIAPWYFTEDGYRGFLKQFNAGFLTSCGITYSGNPSERMDRKYGLHGVLSNIPAQNVTALVKEKEGQVILEVKGRMREACVFAENIELHRTIEVETQENRVHIHDEVINCGYEAQPLMNVYHMNYGYPMLSEHASVYTSADLVEPRDEEAQKGIDCYYQMEKPQIGYQEQCFFHTQATEKAEGFAMIYNKNLELAVVTHYNPKKMPVLCEWKNMQAGDYALGLEPTAAGVMGPDWAKKQGILKFLNPGDTEIYDFCIDFLEEKNIIQSYIEKSIQKNIHFSEER